MSLGRILEQYTWTAIHGEAQEAFPRKKGDQLCGTQRVKKLHSRISAASSLLQSHIQGGEKLALSDLHEAVMKQHEAPHIQGEQKLQSRIIDEAAVKQQFFSNAASSVLHANPRVQVSPPSI